MATECGLIFIDFEMNETEQHGNRRSRSNRGRYMWCFGLGLELSIQHVV